MSIKEQVIHGLDTLSEAELAQVAEFVKFLKFRTRLQPMLELDETQLATLYAACAEEDHSWVGTGWHTSGPGVPERCD
jgi:hypothetical protein